MVRDFARRRGVGITAAIKLAIVEATGHEKAGVDVLAERVRPIIEEIRVKRVGAKQDEKAFMDELWGEAE